MELFSRHLIKAYVYTFLKIIRNEVRVGYTRPLQKIIKLNFLKANNAPDILIQELDKQIAYNIVTKLDAISDTYISSLLGLKPKPDGSLQQIHYLLYP